jgi:hypothetical protein
MHRESVQRSGATNPIVVGDRLDTDVEGANAVGCASLLVLSGVTSPAELLAASPDHRPSYISVDLAGLLEAHDAPREADRGVVCGCWHASATQERLTLRLVGTAASGGPADDLDALRALCAAQWAVDGRAPSHIGVDGDESQRHAALAVLDRLRLRDRSAD